MALLSLFDPLYCREETLELEEQRTRPALQAPREPGVDCRLLSSAVAEEEWADVLYSLAAKEGETSAALPPDAADASDDTYLRSARREMVEWVRRASARHALSALTVLLAVNYLDRCFLSSSGRRLHLQGDMPWMGRLAAAACLSLGAKVEETHVPLPHDLPVAAWPEDSSVFLFEPKTIRRMELLVLSALGWRMNPVTPLSFIQHLLPRLYSEHDSGAADNTGGFAAARVRELLGTCEAALLSVMTDSRWVRSPASVWASAALLYAGGGSGDIDQLVELLNPPKDKVEQCYDLILESMAAATGGGVVFVDVGHKRAHLPSHRQQCCFCCPPSVIGSCFSCESSSSSGDSWEMRPSKRPNTTGTTNDALGGETWRV